MSINVLQLVGSFDQGGSERQAVQLAKLLQESGHCRVHLACLDPGGVLRAEAEQVSSCDIPSFPLTSFYDRNMLKQVRRFAAYLKRAQIDVVHTHDFYTNIFGMTGAALARTSIRVASRRESANREAAKRMVERGAYRLAHAVVANCEEVRQQLIRIEGLPPSKVVTVYNGLDMSRVTPQPNFSRADVLQSFGLPVDDELRFVTIIANMRLAIKDHPMFLRAAKQVRKSFPRAAFVLAGEGELTPSLQAYAAELGLQDAAFFTGRCQRVADLLAVSEICVLSSQTEGFSNSILEYMAAARPCVVTDVGGAREAVIEGENGYVVPPGDDAQMAERIITLLQNPEQRRAMGARGRQMVEEKFSTRAQLERTMSLYEHLLQAASFSRGRAPLPASQRAPER